MRCSVIAVGRASPGPARSLFGDYARRLSPPLALIEVEEKRKLPETQLRQKEAELLLAAAPRGADIIALDEAGISLSSEDFAVKLGNWRDRGAGDLAFLIGGAAGHGSAIRDSATFVWSLGPATWPHMLVRALVAEQLYRGFSILAGHPYHRA